MNPAILLEKIKSIQKISDEELKENKNPNLKKKWVRIALKNEQDLILIISMDLDILKQKDDYVEAVITTKELEKLIEDGIEVVLNHLEPYEIKGVSSTFSLEQELSLDMEDEELAGIGIVDIYGFDMDSEGNIFILGPPARSDNHIFKFPRSGDFIKAFAPEGQGPGEIQYPVYLRLNSEDELPVLDGFGSKLLLFDKEGKLLTTVLHKGVEGSPWSILQYCEPSVRNIQEAEARLGPMPKAMKDR